MMSVDLLIFDLDGTLCDTKDDIATSVNLTLRDLSVPEKPIEEIYSYVGSGVRKLLQKAVGEESEKDFDEAMKIFRGHYMEHLLDTTKPYVGMLSVLDHFKDKKKAVVTNKPQDYADPILDGLRLTPYFDLIVGGSNSFPLKPSPMMILRVLDSLNVEKNSCVMIGDGMQDILAARASGIKVCAVGYGLSDPEGLIRAGPDFFCRTPGELKCLFE